MPPAHTETALGASVAQVLAGAWRSSLPAVDVPVSTLKAIVPLLLDTGGGSLGWNRVRSAPCRSSAAARELRQAYRQHTLEAAIHEDHLQQLLLRLRERNVEPILCKGWSMARLYTEPGLRPYGDHDLCVPSEQMDRAAQVLAAAAGRFGDVDLHHGVADLSDRSWQGLLSRTEVLPLGRVALRVLGAEDHLRLLCLHFWRHGALRPLWLCDVAVCLEGLPAGFDWDYFLHGSRAEADWLGCVLGLARSLLDARFSGPVGDADSLPPWLVPTVLWRWGFGIDLPSFRQHWRQPRGLSHALFYRWFNPIRASYRCHRPARQPLWLTGLCTLLHRSGQVAARLARVVSARRRAPATFAIHRDPARE